jgi:hypothetical protein
VVEVRLSTRTTRMAPPPWTPGHPRTEAVSPVVCGVGFGGVGGRRGVRRGRGRGRNCCCYRFAGCPGGLGGGGRGGGGGGAGLAAHHLDRRQLTDCGLGEERRDSGAGKRGANEEQEQGVERRIHTNETKTAVCVDLLGCVVDVTENVAGGADHEGQHDLKTGEARERESASSRFG